MKGLLNEPKTREKGVFLFSQFLQSGHMADLSSIQDALLSTFRLVINGDLASSTLRQALIAFLPEARAHFPDIVKELLAPKSGFVPKILAHVLAELENKKGRRPTPDLLKLLEVCIGTFGG